ncbi:ubiquinol-cytochrome c reductase core subunit 1 [Actinomortierella ambigua]|uniref:Cytochrome b-c1 complex subunit 2, mitochondrial n=1 Tax=Actinomortierella ambigua TaxID=1343610 RepID=A0A9P6QEZ7_9FUNG|nr:ubiquinol-cytochrome c reductase core subunit 1 [Actinomortierella ambigua]KAG0266964.1 ubiquinol-cytochrome c reductase core subunit 1 [Actinomortierella ambigua]
MLSTASARKTLNLVPTILKAGYATAVAKTGNGIKVAALEENSKTASVSLVINAGARFEPKDKAGISHFVKNFGFKNNGKRSAFRITRETELLGGVLSSSLGRENIVFTAECMKEDVPYFVEVFGDMVTKTKFAEHEMHGVHEEIVAECTRAESTPVIAILDAAHAVAFRSGLGNSIYAAAYSSVEPSDLKAFAANNFVGNKIALVATGVSEAELKDLAASSFANIPAGGSAASSAAKYHGGDIRVPHGTSEGHIAVAFEGAAAGTADFYKAQVLRALLGGERFVKWSTSGVSPLSTISSKAGKDVEVAAFNFGYSDAGLFGLYVKAGNAEVGNVAKAAVDALKAASKTVSAEELTRAVNQAKFEVASAYETRQGAIELLSAQALKGEKVSVSEALTALDNVSSADVSKFAAKVLASKPTTVVLGQTATLPYGDSLF